MTITDLKAYAERMNAKLLPTDKMRVIFNRQAISIVGAFLHDRKASLEKAVADPKIKATKRANREMELMMINDAILALDKAERI